MCLLERFFSELYACNLCTLAASNGDKEECELQERKGKGRRRRRWGEEEGENGTWLVTKDNKKWLQGASRTQSGVNGPHLVPSQNAEETQIIGHTYTHARPDRSRVASSPGPGSPKELSPVVSQHTLHRDQFNVRKREEGEPHCPSVAGAVAWGQGSTEQRIQFFIYWNFTGIF